MYVCPDCKGRMVVVKQIVYGKGEIWKGFCENLGNMEKGGKYCTWKYEAKDKKAFNKFKKELEDG